MQEIKIIIKEMKITVRVTGRLNIPNGKKIRKCESRSVEISQIERQI